MADARLRVFQATVGTAALHQRSEISGCIVYSVAVLTVHCLTMSMQNNRILGYTRLFIHNNTS